MKRRVVFAVSSMAAVFAMLFTSWAATQFYKPNREARLVVSLKNKARYHARDHVVVTVMLNNQGLQPLLINSRMLFNQYPLNGEVAFQIEGPNRTPYPLMKAVTPHEISDKDLTVLQVGETMEQLADLTDMYGLRKKGSYKIQVLYYNAVDLEKDKLKIWRGTVASEPAVIEID